MSALVPPNRTSPGGRSHDHHDDVDRLLASFFESELNSRPFPGCPVPDEPATMMVPVRSTLSGSWLDYSQRVASRLALALSLAVLVGGAWLLNGQFLAPKAPSVQPNAIVETFDPNTLGPARAERIKVTEQHVQPKDGAGRLEIEIREIVPAPR